MENSKIRFIFQNFFIFIFIFASIGQKSVKNQVKKFLPTFPWKLVFNLILGCWIRKSGRKSLFLPRLVKSQSKIVFSKINYFCQTFMKIVSISPNSGLPLFLNFRFPAFLLQVILFSSFWMGKLIYFSSLDCKNTYKFQPPKAKGTEIRIIWI